MPQAQPGDTVTVHYTGRLQDGTVFDSSQDGEPLTFTLEGGQVIPGFEQGVLGMVPGESRTVDIPCQLAYGAHDDDLMIQIDRSQFPDNIEPEVGQHFEVGQADGSTLLVTVAGVSPGQITLDANHPLAGKDLTFDIELVSIDQED